MLNVLQDSALTLILQNSAVFTLHAGVRYPIDVVLVNEPPCYSQHLHSGGFHVDRRVMCVTITFTITCTPCVTFSITFASTITANFR